MQQARQPDIRVLRRGWTRRTTGPARDRVRDTEKCHQPERQAPTAYVTGRGLAVRTRRGSVPGELENSSSRRSAPSTWGHRTTAHSRPVRTGRGAGQNGHADATESTALPRGAPGPVPDALQLPSPGPALVRPCSVIRSERRVPVRERGQLVPLREQPPADPRSRPDPADGELVRRIHPVKAGVRAAR